MQPISDSTRSRTDEDSRKVLAYIYSTYELWAQGRSSSTESFSDRLGLVHSRSANSSAVINKSPQNANRARLSGRRLANATPAEIAAIPPSASGNPINQSTRPASAYATNARS